MFEIMTKDGKIQNVNEIPLLIIVAALGEFTDKQRRGKKES